MTKEEQERRRAEIIAEVKAKFETIQVPGEDALAAWQRLKLERRGTPIVVGEDDSLINLYDTSDPEMRPVAEILQDASKIRFPEDLIKERAAEETWAKEQLQKQLSPDAARAMFSEESDEPVEGEWPSEPPVSPGLSIARDVLSGKPLANVNIALIPTNDWTEVPAYLRWGGWNECPQPEFHVAALRSWRDRYDVELVGMNFDVINLRAGKRPASREEALLLAREQYAYCADIVDQGVDTLSALAAGLMADDWWYFWWD